jgi:hypothetical protein
MGDTSVEATSTGSQGRSETVGPKQRILSKVVRLENQKRETEI